MRKYNKPTVEVVNLKSSENIATTFDSLQNQFIAEELGVLTSGGKSYAASKYVIATSVLKSVEESNS